MGGNKLVMKFDPHTIEHLGIQMYYTLPPVIAELVSNSYDADASKVQIYLNDIDVKSIIVQDDGHGMSFGDINDKFLKIGRNRRNQINSQKSESGKRYVIGEKGNTQSKQSRGRIQMS
jgi:signal transduction histidine kinase